MALGEQPKQFVLDAVGGSSHVILMADMGASSRDGSQSIAVKRQIVKRF